MKFYKRKYKTVYDFVKQEENLYKYYSIFTNGAYGYFELRQMPLAYDEPWVEISEKEFQIGVVEIKLSRTPLQ